MPPWNVDLKLVKHLGRQQTPKNRRSQDQYPKANRFLLLLGDSSYSIYLVQTFTISGFYKVIAPVLLESWTDLLAVLCLLLSVVAGVVLYWLFEKPVARFLKHPAPHSQT